MFFLSILFPVFRFSYRIMIFPFRLMNCRNTVAVMRSVKIVHFIFFNGISHTVFLFSCGFGKMSLTAWDLRFSQKWMFRLWPSVL